MKESGHGVDYSKVDLNILYWDEDLLFGEYMIVPIIGQSETQFYSPVHLKRNAFGSKSVIRIKTSETQMSRTDCVSCEAAAKDTRRLVLTKLVYYNLGIPSDLTDLSFFRLRCGEIDVNRPSQIRRS